MKKTIKLLKEFRDKRRFITSGVPFAKKMWRDGYNKAMDDLITYLEMEVDAPKQLTIKIKYEDIEERKI